MNIDRLSTRITAETSTMHHSSSKSPPPNPVLSDEYNAMAARLDAEVRARAHLESELKAARERAAYFERRLADISTSSYSPSLQSPDDAFPKHSPPSIPEEPSSTPSFRNTPESHSSPHNPQRQSTSEDKEILSHCSDISNCKGARFTDSVCRPNSSDVPSSSASPAVVNPNRKSPTGVSGAVKKGRVRKERPSKVKIPGQSRYWTPDEHKLFLEALQMFGHKDLRSISAHVGTRNMTQVRTHSQKYFMRLMREAKRQNPSTKTDGAESEKAENSPPREAAVPVVAPSVGSSVSAERRPSIEVDEGDKYSVPSTCGMTLLCLVGQDTLPV